MSIRVTIKPLEPNIPGQAQMRIKNWDAEPTDLEFKVQRNQDMGYLNGAAAEWSNSEYWFKLTSVEQDGEGLLIEISADLLDPLIENINANYVVTMRNSQGAESDGRLRIVSGILPSSALGGSKAHQASGVLATPAAMLQAEPAAQPIPELIAEPALEPIVETPVDPEPIKSAEPQLVAGKKKSNGKVILLALLGLLLVLALAALGWWWFQQKSPGLGADSSAAVADVATAASATTPCSVAQMGQTDELQFIQGCLQESNDSNALLAVIQEAKANNHCGIAQRLYANRAQSGDSAIALAYAQEYDPQFYTDNACFKAADTETALYWYETVLLSEPNNAQAMQRIEELTL